MPFPHCSGLEGETWLQNRRKKTLQWGLLWLMTVDDDYDDDRMLCRI
jgi:hypothetical protein